MSLIFDRLKGKNSIPLLFEYKSFWWQGLSHPFQTSTQIAGMKTVSFHVSCLISVGLSLAPHSQTSTADRIFHMEGKRTTTALSLNHPSLPNKLRSPSTHRSNSRKDCDWSFLGQVFAHESVTLAKRKGDSTRPGLGHDTAVCNSKRSPYYQKRKEVLSR